MDRGSQYETNYSTPTFCRLLIKSELFPLQSDVSREVGVETILFSNFGHKKERRLTSVYSRVTLLSRSQIILKTSRTLRQVHREKDCSFHNAEIRFKIFMAVPMKNTGFRNVTPSILVDV